MSAIGPGGVGGPNRDFDIDVGPSPANEPAQTPAPTSETPATPVLPRPGWQDGSALQGAVLRAKLGLEDIAKTVTDRLRDWLQVDKPTTPTTPEIVDKYGAPTEFDPQPTFPEVVIKYGPPTDFDPPMPDPEIVDKYGAPTDFPPLPDPEIVDKYGAPTNFDPPFPEVVIKYGPPTSFGTDR